jgi:hypothetical protein
MPAGVVCGAVCVLASTGTGRAGRLICVEHVLAHERLRVRVHAPTVATRRDARRAARERSSETTHTPSYAHAPIYTQRTVGARAPFTPTAGGGESVGGGGACSSSSSSLSSSLSDRGDVGARGDSTGTGRLGLRTLPSGCAGALTAVRTASLRRCRRVVRRRARASNARLMLCSCTRTRVNSQRIDKHTVTYQHSQSQPECASRRLQQVNNLCMSACIHTYTHHTTHLGAQEHPRCPYLIQRTRARLSACIASNSMQ